MDLFVVDSNFLKTDTVDVFDSLVWTERYSNSGDVTLKVPASAEMRALIVEGIFLHTPKSAEIMIVHSVSTEDGVLTALGNTLPEFLKTRLFRNTWQSTSNSWGFTGLTAGVIANSIVTQMCIAGGIIGGSVLTTAQAANEYIPKLSTVGAPSGSTLTTAVQFGNVYDAIKTVCDLDNLGFTMYPSSVTDGTGNLIFKTYRGLDRTSTQSVNSLVVFDPALDNFNNVKELRSISGYRNMAYVWPNGITAQSQIGVAFVPGADALNSWQRRSMMVEASDVNAADYSTSNLALVLNQKGRDALANNNYVRMLDGQIVPQGSYVYGVDYGLGDLIELRNSTLISQTARITEFIRAQDSNGESAYPTLSVIS